MSIIKKKNKSSSELYENEELTHTKMKNKIIATLLVINSLLILLNIFPFQDTIELFSKQETPAIGIIGGTDGPTAIFISSEINWYIVVLIVIEIALAISLILTYWKKNKLSS